MDAPDISEHVVTPVLSRGPSEEVLEELTI